MSPVPIHRGMTFGYYARSGYYSSPQARLEVDRMAGLGIDWICVVVITLQETFASTRMYADFTMTPADHELEEIIAYIRGKGIKVQLRPMLECWDGTQRIHINFPKEETIIPGKPITHWSRWFESLTARTLHYAELAQTTGCEAFGLDSELDYTVGQHKYWTALIVATRRVYHGHLTTSHTRHVDFLKELRDHPDHWLKSLDSLGTSFYSPLAAGPDATLAEMRKRITPVVAYYREVAALLGKPFYCGEIGCCSTRGAAAKPAGWDNPGGYDGEEQARYLETVLTAFWDEPWWMGLYWWKWEEQNDRPWLRDDPRGDKGFPVWGKPAAEVMKRWYARPERRA